MRCHSEGLPRLNRKKGEATIQGGSGISISPLLQGLFYTSDDADDLSETVVW